MSRHVLLQNLPKYPMGSKIDIPDDETSYLIKGKGYFIQVYRDSELLHNELPDVRFYKIPKGEHIKSDNISSWHSIYHLLSIEESISIGSYYGTYKDPSGNIHNNSNFIDPSEQRIDIYLDDQNNMKSGDLVYKITHAGEKIIGVVLQNQAYITFNNQANRFVPIVEYSGVAGTLQRYKAYALGKDKCFYQTVKPSEFTKDDYTYLEGFLEYYHHVDYEVYIDQTAAKLRLSEVKKVDIDF